MEAAGWITSPFLVIHGISDYADSHKNRKWQAYAAMMAGIYAKRLLRTVAPLKWENEEGTLAAALNQFSLVTVKLSNLHPWICQLDAKVEGLQELYVESNTHFTQMHRHQPTATIQHGLKAPDASTNRNCRLEQKVEDTGRWALEQVFFPRVQLGKSRSLRLNGRMRRGKITLNSTLVALPKSMRGQRSLGIFLLRPL